MKNRIIKDLNKIKKNHLEKDKPLWLMLPAEVINQLPIGLIMKLSDACLVRIPFRKDFEAYKKEMEK